MLSAYQRERRGPIISEAGGPEHAQESDIIEFPLDEEAYYQPDLAESIAIVSRGGRDRWRSLGYAESFS